MIKSFVPSEWKESVDYALCFDDGGHNGFGFPCDENGNLLPDLQQAALDNHVWCLDHPERFKRFNYVEKRTHRYKEYAHGVCECGQPIELWDQYLGACECPACGRWYNLFGQELNPPETWSDGDDW